MWNFLDKPNHNLIYSFLYRLNGSKKNMGWYDKDGDSIRDNWYYLIWFVFRYVCGCDTLEKALEKEKNERIFEKYKLKTLLSSNNFCLYVGGGKHKHPFYKETDIPIILEILYNRYDYLEQLKCFARNTTKYRKKKCLETIEEYTALKGIYKEEGNNDDCV